jgi:hypothetical protein
VLAENDVNLDAGPRRYLARAATVDVDFVGNDERTCASGDADVPAEFMRSLRWKQFNDLWIAERRRQLQQPKDNG